MELQAVLKSCDEYQKVYYHCQVCSLLRYSVELEDFVLGPCIQVSWETWQGSCKRKLKKGRKCWLPFSCHPVWVIAPSRDGKSLYFTNGKLWPLATSMFWHLWHPTHSRTSTIRQNYLHSLTLWIKRFSIHFGSPFKVITIIQEPQVCGILFEWSVLFPDGAVLVFSDLFLIFLLISIIIYLFIYYFYFVN